MIFENKTVFSSIKQSGSLLKKTWGENVIGQFSIGLIFGALSLIGVGAITLAFLSGSLTVLLVVGLLAVIYWTILGILSSSLNGIFVAALYNYATPGKIPEAYNQELIKDAFRTKKRII